MTIFPPALVAHTFPLPFLIVVLVAGSAIGYVFPLIAIYLAWKGSWKAPLLTLILPVLVLFSQCLQMEDTLGAMTTFGDYGILMLLLGLPLFLCLIGLGLAGRNLLKSRTDRPDAPKS